MKLMQWTSFWTQKRITYLGRPTRYFAILLIFSMSDYLGLAICFMTFLCRILDVDTILGKEVARGDSPVDDVVLRVQR